MSLKIYYSSRIEDLKDKLVGLTAGTVPTFFRNFRDKPVDSLGFAV